MAYGFRPYDAPFMNMAGAQCVGDCPNYAALVPSSSGGNVPTMSANIPDAPQWVIERDNNWFHSNQAYCSGQAITRMVKDVAFSDEVDAVAGAMATGTLAPLKDLVSAGTAVEATERTAEHVAESHGAQTAIRGALRSQGIKASANAIGKRASLIGKVAAFAGYLLTAKSGYDAYSGCMAN